MILSPLQMIAEGDARIVPSVTVLRADVGIRP